MPELVSIPISYFEVTVDYVHPNLKPWADRLPIVQGLLDSFKQWEINIDNIEAVSVGKFSEQGVRLNLPSKRATIFFGPSSCKFVKDDASWSLLEETVDILTTAFAVLVEYAQVTFASYKTIIALHVQPKTLSFLDILKPFVPAQLASLSAPPITTMAAVVKWDKRKVTLDGSGSIANGLFLRLEREFPGDATFNEMSDQLRDDEETLFRLLDVEEDRT